MKIRLIARKDLDVLYDISNEEFLFKSDEPFFILTKKKLQFLLRRSLFDVSQGLSEREDPINYYKKR